MYAQTNIKGVFNSNSNLFITEDKNYWIDFFDKGVAKISNNGLMGLMDAFGKVLCTPKYDIINDFEDDIAIVGLNGKFGLINKKGEELVSPQFEKIRPLSENLFIVQKIGKYGNLFGILKNNGAVLIDTKYPILQITKDKNIVYYDGKNIGIIKQDTGEEVAVFKYTQPAFIDNSSGIKVDHTIYFRNGNNISHKVLEYNEGLAITYKQVDNTVLFGFIDKKFKTVIEPQYDWVEPFKEGYALVLKKDRWRVINKSGKFILPLEYESIQIIGGNRFLVSKNGKYGIITESNKITIPVTYESIEIVNDNRFIVSKNDKYGVLNSKNDVVIPLSYETLFHLYDDLYAVGNGKKLGAMDEKQNFILNYEYDGISDNMAIKFEGEISLQTSIPRAVQYFTGYYFDKSGLLDQDSISFSKQVTGHGETIWMSKFSVDNDVIKKTNQKYDYEGVIDNQFKIVGNEITEKNKLILSSPFYAKPINYLKGIINSNDKIVVPLIYNEIIQQNGYNIFIIKKENKYGVINIENKFIINPEYDKIDIIGGVIVVLNIIAPNSHFERAVFDFTGRMIIPFKDIEYQEGNAGALMTDYSIIDKRKL